jgi:hypothetical protein
MTRNDMGGFIRLNRGIRFRGLLGLPILAAFAATGCGQSGAPPVVNVFEVKGKVLLANQKPLSKGRVSFVPTQEPFLLSSASVAPDGSFSLTTGDSGAGAPAGTYKVRVEPDGPPPVVQGNRANPKTLPFPPKYLDEDSSGLTAIVKAEPNQLSPFVLK